MSRTHVAIVHYRAPKDLAACLESLAGSHVASITVVDNGSDRASIEDAAEAAQRWDNVTFHELGANLGFGAGMNRAVGLVPASPDDVVWLLNPDTIVSPGCVEELRDALAQYGGRAIVSPTIVTAGGENVWFGGGSLSTLVGLTVHRHAVPSDRFSRCTFLTGAAMAMRKSIWDELGGFREELFLYWEDTELCMRATQRGIPLVVARDARLWHRVGGSALSSRDRGKSAVWYYFLSRNRLLVCAPRRRRALLLAVTGLGPTIAFLVRAALERSERTAKLTWMMRGWKDALTVASAEELARRTARRRIELGIGE